MICEYRYIGEEGRSGGHNSSISRSTMAYALTESDFGAPVPGMQFCITPSIDPIPPMPSILDQAEINKYAGEGLRQPNIPIDIRMRAALTQVNNAYWNMIMDNIYEYNHPYKQRLAEEMFKHYNGELLRHYPFCCPELYMVDFRDTVAQSTFNTIEN